MVWFDFLTIDHCSASCQFVHQDQDLIIPVLCLDVTWIEKIIPVLCIINIFYRILSCSSWIRTFHLNHDNRLTQWNSVAQSIELFCRLIVENCTMISLSMNDLELSLVKCTCYWRSRLASLYVIESI